MTNKQFFTHYPISQLTTPCSVESYLKNILQISSRQRQKLTRQHGILLNNHPVFMKKLLKNGDTLSILTLNDTDYGVSVQIGPINIIYEDESIIVLNKPPHQLVHPTGQTNTNTLANFLAGHLANQHQILKIRPVHRLDRDTSGCVLFAKAAAIQEYFTKQLQQNTMHRSYQAIVNGILTPAEGTINQPIGNHPFKRNQRAVRSNGENAVTHYRTIRTFTNKSLIELTLDTGRTHQIRVHLAHINHAVIGDKMYGTPSMLINRQALHAVKLEFIHPVTKKMMSLTAPLPPDIEQAIKLAEK